MTTVQTAADEISQLGGWDPHDPTDLHTTLQSLAHISDAVGYAYNQIGTALEDTGLAPISGTHVVALYGFDRIRFVHPVHLGDTISYVARVAALVPRGQDRGIADLEFEIRNQNGRACVVGVIKILLNCSPPA